jgi:glycine reductase
MVGSNRIILGYKIINPVGNEDLTLEEEKRFRREIVERALKSLETEIKEQTIFTS